MFLHLTNIFAFPLDEKINFNNLINFEIIFGRTLPETPEFCFTKAPLLLFLKRLAQIVQSHILLDRWDQIDEAFP